MNWTHKAIESLWLIAAAALPLTFNPWSYNAFELPKALLLRLLALLMGVGTLAQVLAERPKHNNIPPSLLWSALALGLALLLATALSIAPRASLWGSYERQQGLITWGAYLILFLVTVANLRTRVQTDRLWAALVWGNAPVVAYGCLQAVGADPLNWRSDAASPVLSTIGRANFLGSYLVLVIPLTLGRALAVERRWPTLVLLAAQVVCIALTQARGAWVGLGIAGVVFGLTWAAVTRNRRLAIATAAVAVLAVTFVLLLTWAGGPLADLANLPGLERLAALGRTDAGSTAARLTIWRATLPLVAERPGLGYGPETMRVAFARVFPPQLVYYQGRHAVVDRAHNLWLDLGMSAGLAGTLAFAALLVGFGRLAWRGTRAASETWQRTVWVALAAAVAGHLADLQFSFELTVSGAVFWLALGLAGALGRGWTDEPAAESRSGSWLLLVPPTVAALVLAGLVCARPLLADVAFWQSQQGTRSVSERQATGARAVRLWPLEPVYRLGLARSYLEGGDFNAAVAQLDAAERLSPGDPRVWSAWGDLYTAWGAVDPRRYREAESAYRRVLELAPNVATYHAALGVTLARQGRLEEGIAALERAVALDATDGTAYAYLAELYAAAGRGEEATWALREAERWGHE
ncbi:MAG: O-antigen ligase family protein [Anaerolineae bacterium]|nr:O-antigen ligase family protein [Anaerolineae bacterium]